MSDLPDLDIPAESTWELSEGARRPSIEDVGGALLREIAEEPPVRTGEMITAAMGDQWQYQALAAGRMIPSAKITFDYSAGDPVIAAFELARRGATGSEFSVAGPSAGVIEVEWETIFLPPLATDPLATVNGSTTNAPAVRVEKITASDPARTKIRITTWDGAAKTDLRVTVWI